MMPKLVRYRTKLTQSGIFLVRYRTTIRDAGMPMPALVSSMPMPSFALLPRYLFARCCGDPGHCTNSEDSGHRSALLAVFIPLRSVLIRHLAANGLKNFKVLVLVLHHHMYWHCKHQHQTI
jgi:hypothetical protein